MNRLAGAIVLLAVLAVTNATAQDSVRVTATLVSVRSEPNAKAPVLTQAKAGARLEVRGIQGDWFQVAVFVNNVRVQGYVPKSQVTPERRDATAPATTTTATPARATATPPPAATPPATTPVATPSAPRPAAAMTGVAASVEADGKTLSLSPAKSRVLTIADRVESVRDAALALPVGGPRPLPSSPSAAVSYVWAVDDLAGARTISTRRPAIAVQYREGPGISPDDFSPVLVRVIGSAAGPRIVAVVRGRVDQATRSQADWDIARDLKHDVIATRLELKGRGVARLIPVTDLEPGQYAVLLRPTGNKRFAGSSVLSDKEEGRVFGLAWVVVIR